MWNKLLFPLAEYSWRRLIQQHKQKYQFLKLHLGSFDQVITGWINTDITPHIFLARVPVLPSLLHRAGVLSERRYEQHKQEIFSTVYYLNVNNRFPFSDELFDYIYCSHLLEHLYPEDAKFCLGEVYRVLKPDGIFRVAVPDLDSIVARYDPQKSEEFCGIIFEAEQKREKNRHHWHYNEHSLASLLRDVGFMEILRFEYRSGNCADIHIIDCRVDSLFMEAVK